MDLDIVRNVFPVNCYTVSMAYLCKRVDQIIYIVVGLKFTWYSWMEALYTYDIVVFRVDNEGE
jgi:hypothetical protein